MKYESSEQTSFAVNEQYEPEWAVLPLSERDREDLKKSCLTPATVKALGWRTAGDAENRKVLNWPAAWQGNASGLLLQYPGLDYAKVKPHFPRLVDRPLVSPSQAHVHDHDLRIRCTKRYYRVVRSSGSLAA